MPHRASPLVALDGSRLWPLRGAEDGEVQHAAAEADSILDLQQLRLRKLRASAGEDVLMADCMFELARRLDGRARYDSMEKRKSCTESACESAWISASQGATVIALVLRQGNLCSITSGMLLPQSNQSFIKVAIIWFPKQVMANALKTPKCIDFYI